MCEFKPHLCLKASCSGLESRHITHIISTLPPPNCHLGNLIQTGSWQVTTKWQRESKLQRLVGSTARDWTLVKKEAWEAGTYCMQQPTANMDIFWLSLLSNVIGDGRPEDRDGKAPTSMMTPSQQYPTYMHATSPRG